METTLAYLIAGGTNLPSVNDSSARTPAPEPLPLTGERETDEGIFGLEATLPAIVSVTEKINEPRFPSFKGIMAAKKKTVQTITLADIGVEDGIVGVDNAGTTVTSSTPKPPKTAGERLTDEGDGGDKIATYLVGQKII